MYSTTLLHLLTYFGPTDSKVPNNQEKHSKTTQFRILEIFRTQSYVWNWYFEQNNDRASLKHVLKDRPFWFKGLRVVETVFRKVGNFFVGEFEVGKINSKLVKNVRNKKVEKELGNNGQGWKDQNEVGNSCSSWKV